MSFLAFLVLLTGTVCTDSLNGATGVSPLASLAVPLPPPAPLPGSGSRFFPETGKTVTGIFLDYWDAHGALPQFGFPISDVIGEISDLNGNLYTVQYFERVLFEYHPEHKGTPYEVLLAQLGTIRYKAWYSQFRGRFDSEIGSRPGAVFFQETGKYLGGKFLDYWQQNGGVLQQGLPVSNEFSEFNATADERFQVQYFERAVFEYHPENKPPYDILLSQLGRARHEARYGKVPPVGPTPTPNPNVRLLVKSEYIYPSALGRYVFWFSNGKHGVNITVYDIREDKQFSFADNGLSKRGLATDGKTMIWGQDCDRGCKSIYGYDLATGQEFPVLQPRDYIILWHTIDANILYYYGERDYNYLGLNYLNLTTHEEGKIEQRLNIGAGLQIKDRVLLWTKVTKSTQAGTPLEVSLYARKLDGSIGETLVATGIPSGYANFQISGNHIAWVSPQPHIYDIRTKNTKVLSDNPAYQIHLDDRFVIWQEARDGFRIRLVKIHDMLTSSTATLHEERLYDLQVMGIAAHEAVIWLRRRSADMPEIYFMKLGQGR